MEDNDGKTEPSSSDEQEDEAVETCEYCGEPIDTNDWYPVSKRRDSDGSLQFFSFCSEECQDGWCDERSE